MEPGLLDLLKAVGTSAPVIVVLIYAWWKEQKRCEEWIERYRELNRLYRGTLRALNGLPPESDLANGDLRQQT